MSGRQCPTTLRWAGCWHWGSLDAGHLFLLNFQERTGMFHPGEEHE